MADLDRLYAEEKNVTIDDMLAKLDEKHLDEKDQLKGKHEQQYRDLESKLKIVRCSFKFLLK